MVPATAIGIARTDASLKLHNIGHSHTLVASRRPLAIHNYIFCLSERRILIATQPY
jgi:hypothetical protein